MCGVAKVVVVGEGGGRKGVYVRVCACLCVRAPVCAWARACSYVCVCTCMRAHVCVRACVRACVCVCVRVRVRVSLCGCVYVDAYVRVPETVFPCKASVIARARACAYTPKR